jgi:hypothetical protein
MKVQPFLLMIALIVVAGCLLSCMNNTSTNCSPTGLAITPQGGSADHTALPPGNQVQYAATETVPPGCAIPPVVGPVTWTTSDTANTTIGTNSGLATCVNATAQPPAINASIQNPSLSGSSTLSCR